MRPLASLDMDYAWLLYEGITNSPAILENPESDEQESTWTREVAEPWWTAMRDRAARDGLGIECFVGGDPFLVSFGCYRSIAAACLVGRDGSRYDRGWTHSTEALAAIERDWEVQLAAARMRHPRPTRPPVPKDTSPQRPLLVARVEPEASMPG